MERKPNHRHKPYFYNMKTHSNPYDTPCESHHDQNLVVILNDGSLSSIKPLEVSNLKTIILTSSNGSVDDFYKAIESIDYVFSRIFL
jgi:hypothetical protein